MPTKVGDEVQVDLIDVLDGHTELPPGVGGTRYILVAVDSFSKLPLVFRLKSKANLHLQLKNIVSIFRQYGHKVRKFKFDAAFNTAESRTYLANSGSKKPIRFEVAPPAEHAAIPVVERMNRTLQEAVIKMLESDRVAAGQKKYWPHAFSHAAFCYSLIPREELSWRSPREVFSGAHHDLARFPVLPFFCEVAAHVPVDLQKKLGVKSIICKNLGCAFETAGATLLLTPENRTIVRRSYKSLFKGALPTSLSEIQYISDLDEEQLNLDAPPNDDSMSSDPGPSAPAVIPPVPIIPHQSGPSVLLDKPVETPVPVGTASLSF